MYFQLVREPLPEASYAAFQVLPLSTDTSTFFRPVPLLSVAEPVMLYDPKEAGRYEPSVGAVIFEDGSRPAARAS